MNQNGLPMKQIRDRIWHYIALPMREQRLHILQSGEQNLKILLFCQCSFQ